MSLPTAYSDFDEPARDPPDDECGEFICARHCCDGSRCMTRVSFPYLSCYHHDRSVPILWNESDPESRPEPDLDPVGVR